MLDNSPILSKKRGGKGNSHNVGTPLEGEGFHTTNILVQPALVRPTADGYVPIGVINTTMRDLPVPVLTPLAYFVVNPSIANQDVQYTVEEILQKIKVAGNLSQEQLSDVKAALADVRRLFSTKLGYAHGYKAEICTPTIDNGSRPPPSVPPRRLPPEELKLLMLYIKKQLMAGIIEPAHSPFSARPQLVDKPDGTKRLVVDWRQLNELTVKDKYPLPSLVDNLERLGSAKYFTTLDLLMGFHQMELSPEAAEKTAFSTPFGQYQYLRMPMGLSNSPAQFMRLVDLTLAGLPPGIAIAYLDDIIIASDSWEQHMKDIRLVMERLVAAGFTCRCDKVHVGHTELAYLGYLVGADGTRVNPEKTKAILDLEVSNLKGCPKLAAKWLGACGFYARFVKNFHLLAGPFHALKIANCDHKKVMASLEFQAAFCALRDGLAKAVILMRPDYDKEFVLEVDAATSTGCAAILMQEDKEGGFRPISMYSHHFNDSEIAWSTVDLEAYGLFLGVREHRPYSGDHNFVGGPARTG